MDEFNDAKPTIYTTNAQLHDEQSSAYANDDRHHGYWHDGIHDERSTIKPTNDEYNDAEPPIYARDDGESTISTKLDGSMDDEQYQLEWNDGFRNGSDDGQRTKLAKIEALSPIIIKFDFFLIIINP